MRTRHQARTLLARWRTPSTSRPLRRRETLRRSKKLRRRETLNRNKNQTGRRKVGCAMRTVVSVSRGWQVKRALQLRSGGLVFVLAAIVFLAPLSQSASASRSRCFAYYHHVSGVNVSTQVNATSSDGNGGTAQASETGTENIKGMPNAVIQYAIYMRNCKPEWQLEFSYPRAKFTMSGSWSIPNGDGTSNSGRCSASVSDANFSISATSRGTRGTIKLLGDPGGNGYGPQCNGGGGSGDTVGASSLSLTTMDEKPGFDSPTPIAFTFPKGPAQAISMNLDPTHTDNSQADGATYKSTWNMRVQFKRAQRPCDSYIVFGRCGLPPSSL